MTRHEHAQRGQDACAGPAGQFPHHYADLGCQPRRAALITLKNPGQLFPKRPAAATRGAHQAAYSHPDHDLAGIDRQVGDRPLVIAVHPCRRYSTIRARHRTRGCPRVYSDQFAFALYTINDQW